VTAADFAGAKWIARAVPREQRIVRQIERTRVDWAEPGHSLAQRVSAEGPVIALAIHLAGPREGVDPFITPVEYTVSLEREDGTVVAEKVFDGPQIVWDYFGTLVEVSPPAPPGDYRVVLRSRRETIGWHTVDTLTAFRDWSGVRG
jgi:alpha-L-rhamnosidase